MRQVATMLLVSAVLCGCVTEPVPTVITPGLPRSQSSGTLFWSGWQTLILAPDSKCDPIHVRVPLRHRHHRGRYDRCAPPRR
jgi:hypothetical protein